MVRFLREVSVEAFCRSGSGLVEGVWRRVRLACSERGGENRPELAGLFPEPRCRLAGWAATGVEQA
jgi:hypothetical protein